MSTSEIKPGIRSPEGAYNVFEVARACLQDDPTTAVVVAQMIQQRFDQFATGSLIQLVATPNSNRDGKPYGLYTTIDQQPPRQREQLTDILFETYRPELIRRMEAEKGENLALVDGIPVYQPFHLIGFYSAFPSDIIQVADIHAGEMLERHERFDEAAEAYGGTL